MRTSSYVQHSVTVHEHRIEVPLDHFRPEGPGNPRIGVFARELVRPDGEDLPRLVFLQGGPGGKGPRQGDFREGWIGRALRDYRVVLLDQRGTGQSTRMDAQALADLPDDRARADRLMLFRQDQIIADAEALREALDCEKWTTLGQSYGGFLTLAYLSTAPERIEASLITGGLPGLVHVDDIYRLTYERTAARNRAYLERHPGDERTIREIAAHLRGTEELLPTGERLSTERFRMIGMALGMQTATDMLHFLLEGPWTHVRGERRLSSDFLSQVASEVAITPMYGVLQEAIYACATPELAGTATAWSADRLAEQTPGFAKDADPLDASEPYFLTGEHMMRRIFDEDPELAPLAGTSDILASRTDWPAVYDPERLAENTVPLAAAVYYDDMFVPRELSLATAGLVRGARTWVTNEYQHDGLRASSAKVLDHLLALVKD
ncbi:alpha/beta fold hydrolase [Schaalia hyovaginalis]|uniref:alpha/beta fold hydrolase n=1 Tax=Schaalia hyovaginalis TaxID=29316 RepID=UPI0012B353E4|nr:alpha/beta fold hydrolase [Schaalia hyovaginalis]MST63551.1 alpha/beta hydrolase [Schaalia hyovaginalis]